MMNNKTLRGYQLMDYLIKLKDKLDQDCINQFTIMFGNNLSIPVKKIDVIDESSSYEIRLYQEEDSLNPVVFSFVTGQAFKIMESSNSVRIWSI